MSIIDIHTHAFPDELAVRAITTLEADSPWKAIGDGTIDGLIESMDAADIDISVVCTIATKPDQVNGIFNWARKIRNDRIEPFLSVHPDTPKPEKWIEKFAKHHFVGIKLHPMYQDFELDDPKIDRIYQSACEHELIVAIHCGRDIGFPPDDMRASPQRVRKVIDRHPNLKLLCTHMGGWQMWDDVERYVLGTNVYLETSFSLSELPRSRARQMIHRAGVDRVMLGSDWPWTSQQDAVRLVNQLGLDQKVREGILWSNAARLLGY